MAQALLTMTVIITHDHYFPLDISDVIKCLYQHLLQDTWSLRPTLTPEITLDRLFLIQNEIPQGQI